MFQMLFPFPLPLTGKQWFYILFLQGVGAGIIDGGINFAIAYAMYHGQDSVKMWVFSKNTIAGDLGVTCLIQTAVSMLISSTLVHSDLHHSAIKPLPFVYPHVLHLPDPQTLFTKSAATKSDSSSPSSEEVSPHSEKPVNASHATTKKGLGYYWRMLLRFAFEGTEHNIVLEACGFKQWIGRVGWTLVQGLALGVLFGLPLWCLAVLILGPIYKMDNMGNKWAPQTIKLVFAFLLGTITNPIIALLALGSQAQHHLIPLTHTDSIPTPASPQFQAPPISRLASLTPSQRPPLTANVSLLVPPSSPGATTTLVPPAMGRPRAYTNASSTGSIYSLGGTGGRAQRPRAGSRSSVGGGLGSEGLAPPPTSMFDTGRTRSGSTASGAMGRDRSGSVAGSEKGGKRAIPRAWTGAGAGAVGRVQREEMEAPRESLEGRRPSGSPEREELPVELGPEVASDKGMSA